MRVVVVVVVVALFCFLGLLIIVLHKKWYRSGSRHEGKGRRGRVGWWICWAQEERKKERKKERKLGVRNVVDFFLHTKDWSLGAFFWGGATGFPLVMLLTTPNWLR
jgi:hypothetical protein